MQCPAHGRLTEVVAKEFTATNGLPAFHLRAACPVCDAWVKFVDTPGPWFIPRSQVGLGRRDGYFTTWAGA
ncbi:MAG: hypothetical protein KDB63_08885 [Nocardioidaceae bacterium]|nr:hypothetical protein [Nocardioidaceae bacterium]